MNRRQLLVLICSSALTACGQKSAVKMNASKATTKTPLDAGTITLDVFREYKSASCTLGYFAVNGNIIAYTLERPDADNTPLISDIPPGSYPAHLRYDKTDKWRVQLDNVPGRTGVQIHIGNYVQDTIGCILIGKTVSVDKCAVYSSADAYQDFKTAFYGTADPDQSPNKDIVVVVHDTTSTALRKLLLKQSTTPKANRP